MGVAGLQEIGEKLGSLHCGVGTADQLTSYPDDSRLDYHRHTDIQSTYWILYSVSMDVWSSG